MSALAMILTAAMVVPGDGAEKGSSEIAQPKLDVSGRWRGWMKGARDASEVPTLDLNKWGIVDEGEGRLRFKIRDVDGVRRTVYGIYKQRGDHLEICFALVGKLRPTRFEGGEERCLLVLRRVKSSK